MKWSLAAVEIMALNKNIYFEAHLQQTIVNLVIERLSISLVPLSMSKIQLSGLVFLPITKTRYI